jgi:hypothetical protein
MPDAPQPAELQQGGGEVLPDLVVELLRHAQTLGLLGGKRSAGALLAFGLEAFGISLKVSASSLASDGGPPTVTRSPGLTGSARRISAMSSPRGAMIRRTSTRLTTTMTASAPTRIPSSLTATGGLIVPGDSTITVTRAARDRITALMAKTRQKSEM